MGYAPNSSRGSWAWAVWVRHRANVRAAAARRYRFDMVILCAQGRAEVECFCMTLSRE